jgi:protein-S-isoprenylcysteine O-methyltransferase Ste14
MMWAGLALGYHLASRLAYVVGVGVALTRQDRRQVFTRRDGIEAGFRRFRRGAAIVMNNDAVSFIVLCIVTRSTLHIALSRTVLIATGVIFVLIGLTLKLWAAALVGSANYYWRNFFAPSDFEPVPTGPYRFLKNPMYTLGYLPTYGLALVLGSWPGLCAAAFDQAGILVFYHWVEKPHFEQVIRAASRRRAVPVEPPAPPG